MKKMFLVMAAITLLAVALSAVPAMAQVNLALGKSASESDNGWGGGTYKQEITDGARTYQTFGHGLAFTGGNASWGGELAGPRQATINLDNTITFNKVILWHRGDDHIPAATWFDYWNGSEWSNIIPITRNLGGLSEGNPTWAHSIRDEYSFDVVSGSKVRYRFDNSLPSMTGTGDYHGWLYEFEVYNAPASDVPEPMSIMLGIMGLGSIAGFKRLRKK